MKDKIQNKMIEKMRNVCSWGERRFNNLTPEQKARQRGITMIEITAGLVIIALLAIFLVPRVGALLAKTKVETGVQELTLLVTAFEQYRVVEGSYGLISFENLEGGGYHIEPFGEDNDKNAYGQAIEFGPASAGATTFNLTYSAGADNQADCTQIETRIKKLSPVNEGTACNAGVVIFQIGG